MIPGAFKYKNKHSTDFKIVSKSVNRPILPPMRTKLMEIPNRHGVYDFEDNTYSNRKVSMSIAYVGNNYNDLRLKARDIAEWITSKKYERLIFDDEPDKFYLARIYDQIDFENLWRLGRTTVSFDCQPFAYSVELHTAQDIIEDSPHLKEIETKGTYDTPPVIRFTNEGESTINNFRIRVEYEVD